MRGHGGKPVAGELPRRTAYDKALALLARREHSRQELHARLARDGYAEDAIGDALSRLSEARYQDDERFAGMLVRSRISQGYGPQRLRSELQSHGMPAELIRTLLDEADVDWLALAKGQLRRRYGDQPAADYADRARRAQFLMRRGFESAIVHAAALARGDDLA